jgi:hypothetical protein
MNNENDTPDEVELDVPAGQDADGYYGEEDLAGDDLDLSFLDEEADEDEGQEKHTA